MDDRSGGLLSGRPLWSIEVCRWRISVSARPHSLCPFLLIIVAASYFTVISMDQLGTQTDSYNMKMTASWSRSISRLISLFLMSIFSHFLQLLYTLVVNIDFYYFHYSLQFSELLMDYLLNCLWFEKVLFFTDICCKYFVHGILFG